MNLRTRWLALLAPVWVGAAGLTACGGGSAPSAPVVDTVPALTNQNPLTITGTAEAGAVVQVRGVAGNPVEALAGADGAFSVAAPLNANVENLLLVSQTVGGLESTATMVRVTHDDVAPGAPTVDPVTSPTRRLMHQIRGMTEANATILISGGAADAMGTADASGRFDVAITLQETAGEHVLMVRARDVAGNASDPTTIRVTYDPTLTVEAPVLDAFPGFTNEATVRLTGEAEAGVGIRAVGATDVNATAGADGRFEVTVGLRPNQRNELLVFAVAGSDTSAPATAVIVHDDRAPEAPNCDPQASPTGAERIFLTGEAEPGATITVTGGEAAASGAVDETGRFSIDVGLQVDMTNELSVVATDAAGNESDPADLTIVQDSSLEVPVHVNPVRSPTSDATVELVGRAAANVEIEITGGASTVTTGSNEAGDWNATVGLRANVRNELRVTRPGSGVDTIVIIVHDDLPPDPPTVNDIPSPTGSTVVRVAGVTEPFARISVSGGGSPVNTTAGMDGRFGADVTIAEDRETTLSVIATDPAGNSSNPTQVTVRHSSSLPPAPHVDDVNPRPTNADVHVVTGRVTTPGEGIQVIVRGGASEVSGDTDPDSGAFSIEVTLNPNVQNDLVVVSVEGAIESPPTNVTIVHDNIAPDAPDASRISATAGTCVAGVPTGGNVAGSMTSVEARATVRVTNVTRSTNATTTATDAGSFSVGIGTCTGNVIRITATDAAGNISAPTEVTAS